MTLNFIDKIKIILILYVLEKYVKTYEFLNCGGNFFEKEQRKQKIQEVGALDCIFQKYYIRPKKHRTVRCQFGARTVVVRCLYSACLVFWGLSKIFLYGATHLRCKKVNLTYNILLETPSRHLYRRDLNKISDVCIESYLVLLCQPFLLDQSQNLNTLSASIYSIGYTPWLSQMS